MHRVIIVGTVPYHQQSPSRAFESYFHGWDKDALRQIFSDPRSPIKGHCSSLYQITDHRMLKRWFNRNIDTGVIYNYDELPDKIEDSIVESSSQTISSLRRIGKVYKGALSHLGRGILWKKKYWCTEKLIEWLDEFHPECVFLAFSDDFFILNIAMFIADRYKIPILSCIGDDYYFNYEPSLSPFYHIYKLLYRRTVRQVFRHQGSAAYIGNKIRDKYNNVFGLKGETVYLTSEIERRSFRPINSIAPRICYFGNLLLGRNRSIVDIAEALHKINSQYQIHVYSGDKSKQAWGVFEKHDNIIFHGAVPYSVVKKETANSDILLVVEGFSKKDVNITRYSLSTKVADSLSSGASVFGYGSIECGAIEYLMSCECAPVCTKKTELVDKLKNYISNAALQKENYDKSNQVVEMNHRLTTSNRIFRELINKIIVNNNNSYYR